MEIKILISDSRTGVETQAGGLTFAQAAAPGAMAPGAPGTGAGGQTAAATGAVLQPPDYLARAAAAMGAHNGGPAPMLTGLTGGTQGEPIPFTSASIASPAMAAAGAPDQSAGAAPGAERAAPRETVAEEGADEDEEP